MGERAEEAQWYAAGRMLGLSGRELEAYVGERWAAEDDRGRARIWADRPHRRPVAEAGRRVDERVRPGAGRRPWSTLDAPSAASPDPVAAAPVTSLSLEQAKAKLVQSAVTFAGKRESAAREFVDEKVREGWTAAQLVAFAELVWQEYGDPRTAGKEWERRHDERRARRVHGRRPVQESR